MSAEQEYDRYVRYGQKAVELTELLGDVDDDPVQALALVGEAQVYATLALAAATAWGVTRRTTPWAESSWVEAETARLAREGEAEDARRREARREARTSSGG